jgi:biotin carboxylase
MFKKILVANRGGLAVSKAKQIALARASVRAMSREIAYV